MSRGGQRVRRLAGLQRDDWHRRLARPHGDIRPHWFIDSGKLASDASPGNAGSHGARVPFAVTIQDKAHPITKGLPATWMHQGDELYGSCGGPGAT